MLHELLDRASEKRKAYVVDFHFDPHKAVRVGPNPFVFQTIESLSLSLSLS
jgi:hypothetical protein